jgi:phosphoribosylamine--glycine ligase
LPFITEEDRQAAIAITDQVQKALKSETQLDYCGIMYGGFIKTKNGVRLIEYNARFGDPEAMNVLPLLETDFIDIVLACINQELDKLSILFKSQASVCIYLVPSSYPDKPILQEDQKIISIQKSVLKIPNLYTYFASVDSISEDETCLNLKLSSSRALSFTGLASNIEEARLLALSALESVQGNIFYRTDIGSSKLISEKIDLIKSFK